MNSNKESQVQFGLTIPQGWRGGDLPLQAENNPVKQYEFSKSIAMAADEIGFDSIYAYDHLMPFYRQDINKNIFECLTLLSSIAAITKRVKIGQLVTCNSYRQPSLLAKMISTLDIISQGRVELGIGAGWYEHEYTAYGYEFPSHFVRISQLDESLNVIKAMWQDGPAYFEGRFYRINHAMCFPKPIQKPRPVIMVGGSGEDYLLKVAAKHADRYNLFFGSPKEMKRKVSILNEYGKMFNTLKNENGFQYSVVLPCVIRESEEEANQIIRQHKRDDKTVHQYLEYLVNGITVGTPEKVLKGITEYLDIGVRHFVFHFIGLDDKMLKLFHSRVINRI